MRTIKYSSKVLKGLFKKQKIATIEEVKAVLGTDVAMTAFRKLKEVGYRSSYSDCGKYYAVEKQMQFNEKGIWSYEGKRFSRYGTLILTIEAFVDNSAEGYYVLELDNILGVSTKESLLTLFRQGRVWREKIYGLYLYCSLNSEKREGQIKGRRALEIEMELGQGLTKPRVRGDKLKAAIILFFSLLDEKQRRLYVGLESVKQGYGSDRKLANLLGVDAHTVAKGREELLGGEIIESIRRRGGGRPSLKKNSGDNNRSSGINGV